MEQFTSLGFGCVSQYSIHACKEGVTNNYCFCYQVANNCMLSHYMIQLFQSSYIFLCLFVSIIGYGYGVWLEGMVIIIYSHHPEGLVPLIQRLPADSSVRFAQIAIDDGAFTDLTTTPGR